MANSSSFDNRYAVITSIFLVSFLLTVFLFNKRALEPSLSFYRDFFPQTTASPLTSFPSSTHPDSEQPVDSATHQPVPRNETIESKTGDDSTKVEESAENEKDNPDGYFEPGGGLGDNSTNLEASGENEKGPDGNLESGADLNGNDDDKLMESLKSCDLYMGTWVKDEEYPIYEAGSCPYVDEAFDCQGNGRKDSDYLKWRWKPNDCDLPRKNYYKEGDYLYPKFDAVEAYRRALKTWAKWIDQNVDPKKQLVLYRGYSSAHFRGGDWDSGGTCNGETAPVLRGAILNNYPVKMKIVEEVIQEMKNPVTLLNVTRLTNFRKDGHPSIFGKNVTAGIKVSTRRQDCSHWCLPGVPDAWNELIYASLVQQTVSKS